MRVLWKSLVILCFLTGAGLETGANYTEKQVGFKVSIPQQAIRLSSPEVSAALVLKFGSSPVPNFNVVVTPGSYELFESPISLQAARILDSYSSLGVAQAELREAQLSQGDCGLSLDTELRYELTGKAYKSWVKIISGSDRHFTLTFIDLENSNDLHAPARRELFESFCPLSRALAPQTRSRMHWWYAIGAALVLLAIFALLRFRRSFS